MYKTKYILILSLFLLLFACDNLDISSNQAETFVKLFGSWSTDTGNDVKEFNSGYLILTTMTSDNENTEIVLLQTDKYGNLKNNGVDTLSSVRGGNNYASKLLLTSDGGFIVLGTVEDTIPNIINEKKNTNIYVEKFNSSITSEWEQIIGTNSNEEGTAIKKAYSGYIIAGSTDADDSNNDEGMKDIYLVKIDDLGNVEWTKNHGFAEDDYSGDVIVIDNDGYIVVGTSIHPDLATSNIMLCKSNLTGTSFDNTFYGGSNNDYGAAIAKIDTGGYLIVGNVEEIAGSNSNIYVIKVDDFGSIIWDEEYGTTAFNDQGFDIIRSNGGFIIVGTYELTSGPAAYFLKIDGDGEKLVEITYGGYGQIIYAIEPTSDGGYIMTGSSGVVGNEMIYLIKVNSEGEL